MQKRREAPGRELPLLITNEQTGYGLKNFPGDKVLIGLPANRKP